MAREHTGLLDRVSTLIGPGRKRPATEARQGPEPEDHSAEALEARIAHLETVVESLQDALYRHAQVQDERVKELRHAVQPEQIARALSDDARRRGL